MNLYILHMFKGTVALDVAHMYSSLYMWQSYLPFVYGMMCSPHIGNNGSGYR